MKLRSPTPTGTTSQAGVELQHDVAMHIQARIDAEEQCRKRMARAKAARSFLSVMFMLGVLVLIVWAWRSGWLDSALDKEKAAERQQKLGDLFTAPSGGEAAPKEAGTPVAQLIDRMKKSVQNGMSPSAEKKDEPTGSVLTSVAARFAGASVDYWKNATAADKPGKTRTLSFTGLVPKAAGGFDLLEIEMGGGRFAVKRIDESGTDEPLEKAAFDKLVAQTPYLVVREGRAYFCSPGRAEQKTGFAVPADGKAFDPSREEFGALVDCLAAVKAKTPALRYKVLLEIKRFNKTVPVATVGFGESVPRSAFEAAARTLIDDKATAEILLGTGKVKVASAK